MVTVKLRRIFGLFLDFGDLLSLSTRRADFHVPHHITNVTLSERSDVDVVLLAEIGQDQIVERKFHFDPFVVRQRRPDVMNFRDRRFVRFENQNQTREGGGRRDRLEPIVVQIEHHHLRFAPLDDDVREIDAEEEEEEEEEKIE